MFPSAAILTLLAAASAQVLCSPLPQFKSIPSSKLVARQDTSSIIGLSNLSGSGESKYTPPEVCTDACSALVQDLGKCDDDSCVCSQQGLVDFVQCAECDDRISRKHGVVNMTATIEDFRELCEYQNYTMSSFTVPSSPAPSAASAIIPSPETAYNVSAGTALQLTSAAYASLSIHSDAPLPSLIAVRTTAVPVISGQTQHSAGVLKIKSATVHGLLCWAGFVIGWMLLFA